MTVDEFVDDLLTKDQCCDIALPRLAPRFSLEASGALEERKSFLEDEIGEDEDFETIVEKAADEEITKLKSAAREPPKTVVNLDEGKIVIEEGENVAKIEDGENTGKRKPPGDTSEDVKATTKKKKTKKAGDADTDDEIAQTNALRAKVGLKPLRG